MAKKKTQSSETGAKKNPRPASSAKKKVASKKPASTRDTSAASKQPGSKPQPTTGPLIDTSLAAASAARMLMNRRERDDGDSERKGSLIQQLKADLNKGSAQSVSSMLDKSAAPGQKRPNLPFGGKKQVGHNQTFGPDVTRSGVPRRTSG